ncbi:hypothetical protein UFOVP49_229 [uncultured Caudovirales phage]|uniref:Uncharacterized protein n=1 Tax=uncultured Caudovirales phage TaxID=2100421 RepID=A0A6J5KR86_9CAUD|nr:hypothetical protein UFOVP49_229 [uncultured Caudovirales phage]
MDNIENLNQETLNQMSLRSLREIVLHNEKLKLLNSSELQFVLNRLDQIDSVE